MTYAHDWMERLEQGEAVCRPRRRRTREWDDELDMCELIPDPGTRLPAKAAVRYYEEQLAKAAQRESTTVVRARAEARRSGIDNADEWPPWALRTMRADLRMQRARRTLEATSWTPPAGTLPTQLRDLERPRRDPEPCPSCGGQHSGPAIVPEQLPPGDPRIRRLVLVADPATPDRVIVRPWYTEPA